MLSKSTITSSPAAVRLLTLLLAALAAGSAVFWVLQWPTKTSTNSAPVVTPLKPEIDNGKVALLLGGQEASVAGSAQTSMARSDYKLLGVIAAGKGGSQGSALIAVAGAMAKPFKVGDLVANDLVLQSVQSHAAVLGLAGSSGGAITLELPKLP